MHPVERTRDAGTNFDRIHRHKATDILILLGHALLRGFGHGYRRGRRSIRLLLSAGRQQRDEYKEGDRKARRFKRNHWLLWQEEMTGRSKVGARRGELKGAHRSAERFKPPPDEQPKNDTAIDHRTNRHKHHQPNLVVPCTTV